MCPLKSQKRHTGTNFWKLPTKTNREYTTGCWPIATAFANLWKHVASFKSVVTDFLNLWESVIAIDFVVICGVAHFRFVAIDTPLPRVELTPDLQFIKHIPNSYPISIDPDLFSIATDLVTSFLFSEIGETVAELTMKSDITKIVLELEYSLLYPNPYRFPMFLPLDKIWSNCVQPKLSILRFF